ncbi:hypothetical protein DPEC_G00276750 [Dallia pectoralis]|uniref:Uncharacterized protein n=1 Tax=Dallia pectoralis TaxID=75939 RepID=A0ACC2FLT0_DALPE|nr:hypothetical protein DPEC_G00276750 [Dallia pectoralis]
MVEHHRGDALTGLEWAGITALISPRTSDNSLPFTEQYQMDVSPYLVTLLISCGLALPLWQLFARRRACDGACSGGRRCANAEDERGSNDRANETHLTVANRIGWR